MKFKQYQMVDVTTVTDRLVIYAGNVENAFRLLGFEHGEYSKLDVINIAVKIMTSPDCKRLQLTLEDIN